jgi:hypothetical protein
MRVFAPDRAGTVMAQINFSCTTAVQKMEILAFASVFRKQ